jgi:hypothetical protein
MFVIRILRGYLGYAVALSLLYVCLSELVSRPYRFDYVLLLNVYIAIVPTVVLSITECWYRKWWQYAIFSALTFVCGSLLIFCLGGDFPAPQSPSQWLFYAVLFAVVAKLGVIAGLSFRLFAGVRK